MTVGTFMFPSPVSFGSLAAKLTPDPGDETIPLLENPAVVQFINTDSSGTYTLPAPVLGDRFKFDTTGIVRKTRGLGIKNVSLSSVRIRPLFNLSWTWANLCGTDLTTMRSLLDDNIGEQYSMLDVNSEVWRVIILTPANKLVQQARNIYNVTIEAQGILL